MSSPQSQQNAGGVAAQAGTPASGSVIPSMDVKAALAGQEQRQQKRARARFPYSLVTKNAEGKDIKVGGYTEDVSAGGASIISEVNLPLQSMLAIRIELVLQGHAEPIVATGKCVNQTFSSKLGGFRYGVQFVKINDDYKKIIEKYVRVTGTF